MQHIIGGGRGGAGSCSEGNPKTYLLELDSFEYKGKWYTVGHSIAFSSNQEIEHFINNSHIEKKEYVFNSFPFLFGLFGGTSITKKEVREVYCLNKE